MPQPTFQRLLALAGIELTPAGHAEKLLSGSGGLLGILAALAITQRVLGPGHATPLLVASLGASAVLLFAVPHGPLSQPWPLVGGHILSACSGIVCQQLFPDDPLLAAPASVGLAITVMYYARCIHPPGGATSLTAVIGGPTVHSLGFTYALCPVALNVAVILLVAVAFNYPFSWRRYPAALLPRPKLSTAIPTTLSHEHLSFALKKLGSLVDVTEDDLVEIYFLAQQHAQGTHLSPDEILVGRCYANAPSNPRPALRLVTDQVPAPTPEQHIIRYRNLSSPAPHLQHTTTRAAFALWAHQEVPSPTPALSLSQHPG